MDWWSADTRSTVLSIPSSAICVSCNPVRRIMDFGMESALQIAVI